MDRLHREGVQMLTISELQFLNRHMPPSPLNKEVDLGSLQAAWENEKQSLLSAVQSLKDLLAQTHKVKGIDKVSYITGPDTQTDRVNYITGPDTQSVEPRKI
jgi:hypothetical protein